MNEPSAWAMEKALVWIGGRKMVAAALDEARLAGAADAARASGAPGRGTVSDTIRIENVALKTEWYVRTSGYPRPGKWWVWDGFGLRIFTPPFPGPRINLEVSMNRKEARALARRILGTLAERRKPRHRAEGRNDK